MADPHLRVSEEIIRGRRSRACRRPLPCCARSELRARRGGYLTPGHGTGSDGCEGLRPRLDTVAVVAANMEAAKQAASDSLGGCREAGRVPWSLCRLARRED